MNKYNLARLPLGIMTQISQDPRNITSRSSRREQNFINPTSPLLNTTSISFQGQNNHAAKFIFNGVLAYFKGTMYASVRFRY